MLYNGSVIIMKNLLNYCVIKWYENDLAARNIRLEEYLRRYGLDGIEQLIYGTHIPIPDYSKSTVGVHLAYWPYWLDFWRGNITVVEGQFKNKQEKLRYFGGAVNKSEWLSVIRKNIKIALRQSPEYLVWHVAECRPAEMYTFSFSYNDDEVLEAAAEVFNCIDECIPDDVSVFFENLWWPGLRLLDKKSVCRFFSLIKKKNVGIMLDTGHLLNTDSKIENEKQAVEYIASRISALGAEAGRIKGVHLNCSLSGKYQQSFGHCAPQCMDPHILLKHVVAIDQHMPFTHTGIKRILKMIKPDYLVNELNYKNFSQLDILLAKQLTACGLSGSGEKYSG
ncbi:hypothetical protein J2S01_001258 [Pectinatus haikarae]|uniref:Xylose isomerase-like TIM barrel domain-containing protein n=2 Tax=Pectinatus haikarae TaxID=349096 RepID=A0ABT9Y6V4_9FIRM|nr:hypothetical protein [Pectinatus haikarae]